MASRRAAPSKYRYQAPVRTVRPIPYTSEEAEEAQKQQQQTPKAGARADGRKPAQLRRLFFRTGANAQASGSAYGECGNTKVLVAVFGPRPSRLPRFTDQAVVKCDFRFATFASYETRRGHSPLDEMSTVDEQMAIALRQSLEVVARLERYPKSTIDVNVLVLEDDGGAFSLALSLASLALVDAGIEVLDIAACVTVGIEAPSRSSSSSSSTSTSTSNTANQTTDDDEEAKKQQAVEEVVSKKSIFHLDPTHAEAQRLRGTITVASMLSLNEVVQFLQEGELSASQVERALQLALDGCAKVAELMKPVLAPEAKK